MGGTPHRLFRMAVAAALLSGLAIPGPAGIGLAGAAVAAGKKEEAAPAPARKVLVIARVQEPSRRNGLEKETAIELKKRGVETLLSAEVMTEEDFASEETIRHKVETLGVDGVLGYVVLKVDETQKTSSVSVGVGVGVGGYGYGGMGMFVGASVPLGGSTTIVRTVHLRARFWAKPFTGPAWENVYTQKVKDDTIHLTEYAAYDSVKTLKKKKLIPAK